MTIYKSILKAALITAAMGFSGVSVADEIQNRTIRIGHFMSTTNPISLGVQKFAELVAEKSDGKLKVREFPSGQLGPESQQQSALIGGTQQMTVQASSHLVGSVKDFGLLDLPFIVRNEAQADELHDGPLGQALLDQLPEKGLVGLGYWENGFRHITNSKHPIHTPEDMNGLKLRVQSNPVFIETFEALGTNPVPMSFSELYTALETKAIDAQENPLSIVLSSKFFEVQKYASLTSHAYGNVVVLIGKSFWDGLSETEQNILQEAFSEAQAYQREASRKSSQEAVAALTAEGMEINEVSEETITQLAETTKPVTDKFLESYSPEIVELFKQEQARILN